MKKCSTLVLVMILCFSLPSCASNNTSSVSNINTKSQSESNLSIFSVITSSFENNDSSDNTTTSQNTWINYAISNESTSTNQNAIDVSIIQLIANPEKYQNRVIRVMGVGNVEFEGDAVYLSKDDWKYGTCNSIWLNIGDDFQYENAGKINGKYVIIEGTFNMNNKGHLGLWFSSIENITRYQLWER